jgi:hypothetical protein
MSGTKISAEMTEHLRALAIIGKGLGESDIMVRLPARILRAGLDTQRQKAILDEELI